MTAAALLALLKRVPGMAWVFAFVLAFFAAWGYAMYHKGHTDAVRRGHELALTDSVRVAVAKRDTAEAHSDTVVKVAAKARASTEQLLERRVAVRQAALGELLDTLPHIHALVALDDSIAASAKVLSAVDAGMADTFLVERATHHDVDTLRVNQVAIGVPAPETHHLRDAAIGAVVVSILYGIVKAVTR